MILSSAKLPRNSPEAASRRYFERDLIVPPVEVAPDGTVAVPTSPGLGFEIDVPFLESRTEHVERIGS